MNFPHITRKRGFTLLELLVVVVIIAVLAGLLLPALGSAKKTAWKGVSTHCLKTLMTGGQQYLGEHQMTFWPYVEYTKGYKGTIWWFGAETLESSRKPEGERTVDFSLGPLGPYIAAGASLKSDPAFTSFSKRHKPKYQNALIGYGYNAELGGGAYGSISRVSLPTIQHPSQIVVFATCAQVNTFQGAASASNPMLEEFCLLDRNETTVHFRYGDKALCAFADGSVRELEMDPSTKDSRMPEANIGRFAPVKSVKYLLEE